MDDSNSYELIQLGAKILAMVHMGVITYNCGDCLDTQGLSESLNCIMDDVDDPVWIHGDIGELYACPIRYLTPDIYEYYDRYDYNITFTGSAETYDDMDRSFWEFVKTYKSFKNKYEIENIKKDSPTNKNKNTDSNLSKLRNQFLKKDK